MPYDLWVRSNSRPPAFEPERIPVSPIPVRYDAEQIAVGYTAADRDILVVELDHDGKILDVPLSADELNAIAQGSEAVTGPTIVGPDGIATPVTIALGTDGRIVDPAPASSSALQPPPFEPHGDVLTTRYDSGAEVSTKSHKGQHVRA